MNLRTQLSILRAHAAFVGIAAIAALATADLRAAFFGAGPFGSLIAHAPSLAIGFVEAHGLALILAALMWTAAPQPRWHAAGLAIALLLGTCNLVFWDLFALTGTLAAGWITTTLHFAFAALQAIAWLSARARDRA
ncbi:MAG TPA: hypothetical protein VFL14_02635 [Xanthomonadales bacterium]|nr:hypothetical protein [Xanthomonadales bacterium]